MADTFNLAWKLAHVLQQKSHPDILKTYESERGRVAAELIEFDRKVRITHLTPSSAYHYYPHPLSHLELPLFFFFLIIISFLDFFLASQRRVSQTKTESH